MKRLFDIVFSLIGLVCLAPLFALVTVAIRLSSPGPALFRQLRIGKRGRRFTVLKFRTMHLHDPEQTTETWDGDPRIFPVGRFLREYHIDELPQLFNVLIGHMSVVGPRPSLPEQVGRYTAAELERLKVRPGVTGLAQVSGNNTLEWRQRIEVDREYVQSAGLWTDMKILWRTVAVVARKEGVYGSDGHVRDIPDRHWRRDS